MQSYVDVEASPSRLGHLERRFFDHAQWVFVRVEDLERDLVEPRSYIGVAIGNSYIDGPTLRVVVGDILGTIGVSHWG